MNEPLKSLTVGGLALSGGTYTVGEYDLPDAELTDFGRAAQLAGAGCYEQHYADAPWQFTINIHAATPALIDAAINAVVAGASLVAEGELGSYVSTIVSARTVGIDYCADAASVMFSGTRRPAWDCDSWTFDSGAVAGNRGSYALPTVGGTLAAKMELYNVTSASATIHGLGIKHAPASGYDATDGTGAWAASATLSATAAEVWAGADIDVAANTGSHIGIAYVRHSATAASAVKWRLYSTLLSSTAMAPYVLTSGVASSGAWFDEVLNIGKVDIPAALLPQSVGTVYGARAAELTVADASGTYTTGAVTSVWVEFVAPAHMLLTDVTIRAYADGTGGLAFASLYSALNGTWLGIEDQASPHGIALPTSEGALSIPLGPTSYELTSGTTYAFLFILSRAGGNTYFSKGATTANVAAYDSAGTTDLGYDVAFILYGKPALSFNAKTPIYATSTQAGKFGAFLWLTRIPADAGALIATGTFAASGGVYYEPSTHGIYPCTSAGVSGVAIDPMRAGIEFAPLPGENTIVYASDANSGGTTTLSGTVTERRLRRG